MESLSGESHPLHEQHRGNAWQESPVELRQDGLVQCVKLFFRLAGQQWVVLEENILDSNFGVLNLYDLCALFRRLVAVTGR